MATGRTAPAPPTEVPALVLLPSAPVSFPEHPLAAAPSAGWPGRQLALAGPCLEPGQSQRWPWRNRGLKMIILCHRWLQITTGISYHPSLNSGQEEGLAPIPLTRAHT